MTTPLLVALLLTAAAATAPSTTPATAPATQTATPVLALFREPGYPPPGVTPHWDLNIAGFQRLADKLHEILSG